MSTAEPVSEGGTPTPGDGPGLEALLPAYLGRQRWFGGDAPARVTVLDHDELAEGLGWFLVDADGAAYQLVVGTRPADQPPAFLHGHEDSVIGDAGGLTHYDALIDQSLALALLPVVAPGHEAKHARPMGVEQTNTSIVYDDHVVVKLFRRVRPGANPDIEVTNALAAAGFPHVPEPVGVLRRGGLDLAVAQRFLPGAAEGWAMALTSLRDLYATECEDPADCGGDFAGEATRLGEMTARMHLALADAFGSAEGDGVRWAAGVEEQLSRLEAGDVDAPAGRRFVSGLRSAADVGRAIRVHGDYHLGQVIQADGAWYVLDFEGEPARSIEERTARSSPLKDVAGMVRSFQYAAAVALSEQDATRRPELEPLAQRWEARNRLAFLHGYTSIASGRDLVPAAADSFAGVLAAFELDKAVYEVLYERAHRPDWVGIPLGAIHRLLSGA